MIVPDTSIWIDHIRKPDALLLARLADDDILVHPFVIGEIALGSIIPRTEMLEQLALLPSAEVVTPSEALEFIERHGLFGRGIGYVDAHLLASTRLTPEALLWTRDRRLRIVAEELGLAAGA